MNELMDRLAYAIGLGTVMFILASIPALLWPQELGRFFTGATYIATIVVAYFLVPFARRYMPRIKPRGRQQPPDDKPSS